MRGGRDKKWELKMGRGALGRNVSIRLGEVGESGKGGGGGLKLGGGP